MVAVNNDEWRMGMMVKSWLVVTIFISSWLLIMIRNHDIPWPAEPVICYYHGWCRFLIVVTNCHHDSLYQWFYQGGVKVISWLMMLIPWWCDHSIMVTMVKSCCHPRESFKEIESLLYNDHSTKLLLLFRLMFTMFTTICNYILDTG